MDTTPVPAVIAQTDETTKTPIMRFLTRGGAQVHVTESPGGYDITCHGCDYTSGWTVYRDNARKYANGHASECWSMPKSTAA